MKMKSIVMAVAAATLSGQALALSPTTIPDMEVWLSGSSAQDGAIGTLFSGDLCVAGTYDLYLDNSATPGSAQRAVSCTLDSTKVVGLSTANPKVLIHKRSAGGSAMGVQPVADGTAIEFMNVNGANCTATVTPNVYSCAYNVTTNMVKHVPDAGFSDVDPGMFVGVNTPSGYADVTAVEMAALTIKTTRAGVFGVPVTVALRNALQQAQGLVVGDETVANMPSLSRDQIASLMAIGGITKWSSLMVGGTALTAYPGVTAPASSLVNICRRVQGSGTQAATNAVFLNNPCASGALQPASASNTLTGPIVTQNSGSGDVETCLDTANTANKWAIGVQGTAYNKPDALGNMAKGYRFIKVDGVAPTAENVYNNTYPDWVEETMQWRTGVPAADVQTILSKMSTDAGKPSIISSFNVNQTWGLTGYLSLNTNGYAPSTVWTASNPVATATHGVSNCRLPLINKSSNIK